MNSNTNTLSQQKQIIKQDEHRLLDKPIQYTLLYEKRSLDARYQLCIRYDGEECTAPLPTKQEQEALALYEKLIQGSVTPCTLFDIAQDLAEESEGA